MLHKMFDRDQTLSNIFSNINVGPTWGDKRSNNVVSNIHAKLYKSILSVTQPLNRMRQNEKNRYSLNP